MRPGAVGALALLLAAIAGCATEAPITETRSSLIDGYRTREELEGFLGTRDMRCMPSRPDRELCGWVLGHRSPAWKPIAESVGTRRKVNVVCELPRSGQRAPGSCSVYPCASLPFELARQRAAANVAAPDAGSTRREQARAALDSARDLAELSRLVGAHPDECLRRSQDHQLCRWRLSSRTPGHRLIAAAIDEEHQVVLSCRLPYDGSPREPGSCDVRRAR